MPGLNLTRIEASERAEIVNPSRYEVTLDLRDDAHFAATTTIHFDGTPEAHTFVDLVADEVQQITLNGVDLSLDAYADNRISVGPLEAQNTLTVRSSMNYMHTGEGLHAFVDPADGERYCYSQFEVPDARRVFATFEQPDLKAVFQFTVTVPKNWKVFSNSPTPDPEEVDGGLRYSFADTPKISTYVTAVVAGPYFGKTDSFTQPDGTVTPLGVYCRQSLAQHLDADFIFDITKAGMGFFAEAYGMPYPFEKYDQLFVPEYNMGAMENVGCVTFRDQYIFRSKPTEDDLENVANVILHELAHMWFGNLVTMKWWDDLWLNESFAEFMAHLASAEATQFTDAWIGFLRRKEWGMKHDQMPTTHPIRAEIKDLDDVESNFDGITYAKGAAVLRQLVTYVGREKFLAGIHEYLTEHAHGNATLDDLLGALERTSGRDLRGWSKVWLEESGVTTLTPEIEVDEAGRVSKLVIRQSAHQEGVHMRPQRLAIAGYDLVDGDVTRVFEQELDVDGETTEVPGIVGQTRPPMLIVNDRDLAYAKIRLDKVSLDFALENLTSVSDPMTRRVLLGAAWDMLRDGELSAHEFCHLALSAIPTETSSVTLKGLLMQLASAASYYSAPESRGDLLELVARRVQLDARTAASESDAQRMLVQYAAALACTKEQFETIEALYKGTQTLHGLKMDEDMSWSLLLSLVRGGLAGEEQIAELEAKDQTMSGKQKAAEARASIDDDDTRRATWDAVMFDPDIPNDTRWAMANGFWAHVTQSPESYEQYVTLYFEKIVEAWDIHTFHIASELLTFMYPSALAGYLENQDVPAQTMNWLESHPDQSASAKRLMTESLSEAERHLQAQKRDQEV